MSVLANGRGVKTELKGSFFFDNAKVVTIFEPTNRYDVSTDREKLYTSGKYLFYSCFWLSSVLYVLSHFRARKHVLLGTNHRQSTVSVEC